MALRIPSPVALTKPEAYLAYKAGILSRGELKDKLLNPINNYEGWLAKWCELLETYPTNEDGTPQCLTDEEGLLAYLCGVTDRYPATNSRPDDARVSAYIRYLVSARYARPDHPLNREEFYLSLIKTQFIPSGNPSSDIVIDGTTKAPFLDVKVYGDSYQQTYSGKNLIQPSSMYAVSYNVTVESGDSSVNITSGTGYATYTIPTQFKPTDKVTFSCKGVQKSGTGLRVAYRHSDDGATWTQYVTVAGVNDTTVNQQYSLSGTITGYAYYQIVFFARGYSSTTATNNAVYSEVQFEKGDTATTYEPYVGGIPAPNPSYPQPISVVTGENVVKITDGTNTQSHTIDLGTIELAKIGTYQDRIYKNDGRWYVEKQIEKTVIDGTYNDIVTAYYAYGDRVNAFAARVSLSNKVSDNQACVALSDKFHVVGDGRWNIWYTGTREFGDMGSDSSGNGLYLGIPTEYNTVALVKSYFTSNPTTVYYALATPTVTEITNQTLIDQLNALKQGGAEEGTTYIRVSATDPNLPAKLYVEAPKYD